jgi:hypothetical protein
MRTIINSCRYFFLTIGIAVFVLLGSCKRTLDIPAPIDQLTTDNVFTDSSSVENAIIGVYSLQASFNFVSTSFLCGNVTLYPGLSSDELHKTAVSLPYTQYEQNALSANNTLNESNWANAYNIIYQCNLILEHLSKATTISTTQKTRIAGESKFMRALNYFYLTNEYGPVALTTSTDYKANSLLSRSDSADVYRQVIADLSDAEAALGPDYPTVNKVRANKYAAAALLARVYLYQKDYANAVKEATTVLSSGMYSLSAPANTFLPNNSEVILQLMPPSTSQSFFSTPEGNLLAPYPAAYQIIPDYTLTAGLVSSFESGDLRRTNWTQDVLIGTTTYTCPYKYKQKYAFTASTQEWEIALRLADTYLVRAEALANEGQLPDAITDLDQVRARAGLPKIATTDPSISQAALTDTIFHERRIEFFTEWGHRWFDLKRTGRINSVMTAAKGNLWKPAAALYPIPLSEVLSAPNIGQNDGYN